MFTRSNFFLVGIIVLLGGCGQRSPKPAERVAARNAKSPSASKSVRPIYRHSVLPGGVQTAEELKARLKTDSMAAKHYSGVPVDRLRPVRLDKEQSSYVSYRRAGKIYWTSRKVRLSAGELVLASAGEMIRARCGNRVSAVPQSPVAASEPPVAELDVLELPLMPGRINLADISLPSAPPEELALLAMVTPPTAATAEVAGGPFDFLTLSGGGGGGGGGLRGATGGPGGGSGGAPSISNPVTPSDPGSTSNPVPGSGSVPGTYPNPKSPTAPPSVPPIMLPPSPPGSSGPPVGPPGPPVLPPITPPSEPPTVPPTDPPLGPPPTDPPNTLVPPVRPSDPPKMPEPVPEPSTLTLLGAGVVLLLVRYRLRR